MGNSLSCSVIVPTYNRRELLRHTLVSLTMQSLPRERFEVLVVDDGSSDGTPAVVEEFRDVLNLRYFYQADDGFQVSKARNVAISRAEAPVCVFVDTGVLLHSGCLAAHLDSHESAPGPVAVIGYIYGFDPVRTDSEPVRRAVDPSSPDATVEVMRANGWLDVREHFYARYTDAFGDEPAPWLVYWTGNASARTEQLRAVGMFDEAFRQWGGEDVDLGFRLHLAGARIVLNREAKSVHVPHETSFDDNMESSSTNLRYMAEKYGTPIVGLFAETPPEQVFDLNTVIRARGLPRCADFLARHAVD
ncbi:glycosyltransferase family 2 protein [Streptosporangium carneum]|uniref:Glycosyl transferase n=1 Tax=Streptosporangium carneum TaxID=47481 RepID=A0A9W6I3J4_9ACTN|nr:glycosyltransferase [Streptosporangium carneum]GLK11386.1 glycosyl transferase [Streptosporangium carneum]